MARPELPDRVLRTSFWLAAWFVFVFGVRGQADISVGLAIGCAMSLFSFWTLVRAVPRALAAGSERPWLLGFVLIAKLPIYGVVLHYSMSTPGIEPMAIMGGVLLAPCVIALKTIGQMMFGKTDVQDEAAPR